MFLLFILCHIFREPIDSYICLFVPKFWHYLNQNYDLSLAGYERKHQSFFLIDYLSHCGVSPIPWHLKHDNSYMTFVLRGSGVLSLVLENRCAFVSTLCFALCFDLWKITEKRDDSVDHTFDLWQLSIFENLSIFFTCGAIEKVRTIY